MARLDFIHYEFFEPSLRGQTELVWTKQARRPIDRLPQIFWDDGRGWHEANIWALDRAASNQIDAETTKRTMKHLSRYADFIEAQGTNWQHFPVRREEQVLRKFRKHLIDEVGNGTLAGSTAANCMNAVIQFYRFADLHGLVRSGGPMWTDRLAVIPFYDAAGFKRSMVRLTNDLKIPNRKRVGAHLEDGLVPLRSDHMRELLAYTAEHETEELHLMLSTGFFTGARVGTVTSLTVSSLQTSREDPQTPGIYLLAVGPGTGIDTKFSVTGNLMIPHSVLVDLRAYATSTERLLREAKADQSDKDLLFLARSGRPYSGETMNRLVAEMRKRAVKAGLEYMHRFRFHQSRATFGTWLMQILLDSGAKTDAIRVVRDAMLHKDEKTTLAYITFLENVRVKKEAAAAFNEAFTGLRKRDWNNADA